jgi:hypothetical protein
MCRRVAVLIVILLVLVKGSPASAKLRPAKQYTGPGMKRVCPIAIRYRLEIDKQITFSHEQSSEFLASQSNASPLPAERLVDEGQPLPTGDVLLLSMRLLI